MDIQESEPRTRSGKKSKAVAVERDWQRCFNEFVGISNAGQGEEGEGEDEKVEVEKEIAEGFPPVELRGGVIHDNATSVEDVEEIAENLGSNTNNVDLIIQRENIRSSRRSSYVMLIFTNI